MVIADPRSQPRLGQRTRCNCARRSCVTIPASSQKVPPSPGKYGTSRKRAVSHSSLCRKVPIGPGKYGKVQDFSEEINNKTHKRQLWESKNHLSPAMGVLCLCAMESLAFPRHTLDTTGSPVAPNGSRQQAAARHGSLQFFVLSFLGTRKQQQQAREDE